MRTATLGQFSGLTVFLLSLTNNPVDGFGTMADPRPIAVDSKPPTCRTRAPMTAVLANENNRPRYAVLRHALIGGNTLASRRAKRGAL